MTEEQKDEQVTRPLGLNMLTGLYLFFFLVTASTFGHPFPLLGRIHQGTWAEVLVLLDSLICLYFFLGLLKRQLLTWYLLIAYNLFEIINTIVNLNLITASELEKILGQRIDEQALFNTNMAMALGLLLLTQFIYKQKRYFTNRAKYLF